MGRNWIIDVIADLHTFAQRNELPLLANELAKAKTIAVVELDTTTEGAVAAAWGEDADSERIFSQSRNS
jgi:hypothetical protein